MYQYKGHRLGGSMGEHDVNKLDGGKKAQKVNKGCWQVGRWYWYWSLVATLRAILGSVLVKVAAVDVPWSTCRCCQLSLSWSFSLTITISIVIKIQFDKISSLISGYWWGCGLQASAASRDTGVRCTSEDGSQCFS